MLGVSEGPNHVLSNNGFQNTGGEMVRTLIGLGFGVILLFCSIGASGIGHGSSIPMAFSSGPLLALIEIFDSTVIFVLIPFVWGSYFLFIPRLAARQVRATTAAIVLTMHMVIGSWVAAKGMASGGSLATNPGQMLGFLLILAVSMTLLLYFARRGAHSPKS